MKEVTFDELRKSGNLLYEYTRGSHLFGLATPSSDLDTGGVFIAPPEWILGLGLDYQDHINSAGQDDSWAELKKFFVQLSKSSPESIEALFVPVPLRLFQNPLLDNLFAVRDQFLTKAAFKPFANYAVSQIGKSRGENKAMMIDPEEVKRRKTPIEFCYVPIGAGTVKLSKWLSDNDLKEEYCGLSSLPNYTTGYSLFYNWTGAYGDEKTDSGRLTVIRTYCKLVLKMSTASSITDDQLLGTYLKVLKKEPGTPYRGILSPSDPDTTQLRLSSIPKGPQPLCHFQFGVSAFTKHCLDYKRYHEWVSNRNQARFSLEQGKTFNAKNVSHCVRLINQAIEIAQGDGLILDRSDIDRDFLLSIRNHEIEFDEIIKYVDSRKKVMDKAFEESKLPDLPPIDLLEKELVRIRLEFLNP